MYGDIAPETASAQSRPPLQLARQAGRTGVDRPPQAGTAGSAVPRRLIVYQDPGTRFMTHVCPGPVATSPIVSSQRRPRPRDSLGSAVKKRLNHRSQTSQAWYSDDVADGNVATYRDGVPAHLEHSSSDSAPRGCLARRRESAPDRHPNVSGASVVRGRDLPVPTRRHALPDSSLRPGVQCRSLPCGACGTEVTHAPCFNGGMRT
jgi:hypothetical protein